MRNASDSIVATCPSSAIGILLAAMHGQNVRIHLRDAVGEEVALPVSPGKIVFDPENGPSTMSVDIEITDNFALPAGRYTMSVDTESTQAEIKLLLAA